MDKKDLGGRDDEFAALMEIDGVDTQKILEQAGQAPPAVIPPVEDTPPVETPPAVIPPAGETPPATPPVTPPETPPAGGEPPAGTLPVDANQVRADTLKEIFGDQFKTVDEAKQANITGQLQELGTLREGKTDLEAKLAAKPKTAFANDDIALFNEFVKETGNNNFGVFNTVNSADIANMDTMDAMVTLAVLETPALAGQEGNLKKSFERKYNLDPEKVEESELALNKVSLLQDGEKAKKSLLEVKSKLKMPEPAEEIPPASAPKVMTDEEKQSLQTNWGKIATKIGEQYGTIPIPMKDSKEPVLSYQIDGEIQKVAVQGAVEYCVQNQMELNEDNVKRVAGIMQNQLLVKELPNIVHSVFEKARSLTEEQVTALYDNPSPNKNTDTPPTPPVSKMTPEEEMQDKAFRMEMGEKV